VLDVLRVPDVLRVRVLGVLRVPEVRQVMP